MARRKLERHVENAGNNHAKKRGYHRILKLNTLGHRSYPDRLYFIPGGCPLIIEYKKEGKEPTDLQADTIADLLELGYDVHVIDTKEQAIAIIDQAIAAGQALLAAKAGSRGTRSGAKARSVGAEKVHEARGEVAPGTRGRRPVPRSRSR